MVTAQGLLPSTDIVILLNLCLICSPVAVEMFGDSLSLARCSLGKLPSVNAIKSFYWNQLQCVKPMKFYALLKQIHKPHFLIALDLHLYLYIPSHVQFFVSNLKFQVSCLGWDDFAALEYEMGRLSDEIKCSASKEFSFDVMFSQNKGRCWMSFSFQQQVESTTCSSQTTYDRSFLNI